MPTVLLHADAGAAVAYRVKDRGPIVQNGLVLWDVTECVVSRLVSHKCESFRHRVDGRDSYLTASWAFCL
jgi:hypothetical protein